MSNIELTHKEMEKYYDTVRLPVISLIFEDGYKKTFFLGLRVRGVRHKGKRPIAVEWYEDSVDYLPTEKDIKWMYTELLPTLSPKSGGMKTIKQGLLL